MGRNRRADWVQRESDVRFLACVDPLLLQHPMVRDAGVCAVCETRAPEGAASWRRRRVIETIVAAETETFDQPVHGVVWNVEMPAFVGCGHVVRLPLPVRETPDGRFYYARESRRWP